MRDLPPIHPGEQLREEFMKPLRISAYRLAKDIGVPVTRIQDIIAERRAITGDTALRLARYFDTTPEFWLNMQRDFELRVRRGSSRRSSQERGQAARRVAYSSPSFASRALMRNTTESMLRGCKSC